MGSLTEGWTRNASKSAARDTRSQLSASDHFFFFFLWEKPGVTRSTWFLLPLHYHRHNNPSQTPRELALKRKRKKKHLEASTTFHESKKKKEKSTREATNMLRDESEVFTWTIIQFKQGPLSSQMMINDWRGAKRECARLCVSPVVVLVKRSLWGQKHFFAYLLNKPTPLYPGRSHNSGVTNLSARHCIGCLHLITPHAFLFPAL